MEKFFRAIVNFMYNIQEKHYAHKYKNQTPLMKFSSSDSTTKTHLRAGISLVLNSKTKANKLILEDNVKRIVKDNINKPNAILEFVEKSGTKVYKIPYADKLLAFVGEQEGFITPINGVNAVVLNLILAKKIAFRTEPMFVLRDMPLNIYVLAHQLHKWYGHRMELPGFDDNAQKNFKKIWEFELEENVKGLSYEDTVALKEAIQRDIEAIDFVVKLSKESEGAKKAFQKMVDKEEDTNV